MRTVCLCAVLFGLSLLPATAWADPPVETAASPDYNLFADPSASDVTQKAGGTVPVAVGVRVLPINGFRTDIGLSAADLPPGVSAAFRPAVVSTASGNVRSRLTLSVSGTVRPGLYLVDVQSKVAGSHLTRHTPLSLLISPPVRAAGFTLTVSPDGMDIEPGDARQSVTFTLKPNAMFRGPVTLRLQDDPAAVLGTPKLSTRTLTARRRASTLTFRLRPHAAEGFHNLLVTATSPSGTQTVAVPIQVLPDTRHATPERMPTITERPGQPEPPLAAGPEDMIRHNMNETEDAPPRKSPKHSNPMDEKDTEDTGDALNLPPRQKLITVRATVRDNAGKPPVSASMRAVDNHGGPVENPDLVARVFFKGKLEDHYPQSPAHYFVTISAQGCFDSAPQEISGLHDANLTFVLKRRPKVSRPKHHAPR